MQQFNQLKKKVLPMLETQAQLGEVDDHGNEVLANDAHDDVEDDVPDFQLADLEGLVNNLDIEWNRKDVVQIFRSQVLDDDRKMLEKVLNGNFLLRKDIQKSMKGKKRLRKRVSE